MGSNISIGFIYERFTQERIVKELGNIIKYLFVHDIRITKMKVSKDIDGEDWIEYDSINTFQLDSVFSMLAEYYYGQLEVSSNVLGCNNLAITIRVEKEAEKDYFGFLLDISEEELIKFNSIDEINKVTERIIDFIIDIHSCSGYDYAICDNEAEIQYSPAEFGNLAKAIYSIAIIPSITNNSNVLKVIKSSWNIDGLTSRN